MFEGQDVGRGYLEDGVHGDRQRTIPGVLGDLKHVDTPSVHVFHFLQVCNKSRCHMLQESTLG